jgi:deoxyadenosine/deoxycytidine kinase
MAALFTLEGPIGAGKSTLLAAIAARAAAAGLPLRTAQEPVDEWSAPLLPGGVGMLQAFYADPRQNAFPFQMYVLLTRVRQVRAEPADGRTVLLSERCITTDREVFAKSSRAAGMMSDVQWAAYDAWYNEMVDILRPAHPSGVIYLRCTPEVSLRRIADRARGGEATVDTAYLERLQRAHEEWMADARAAGTPVLELDGDLDADVDSGAVGRHADEVLRFMAPMLRKT